MTHVEQIEIDDQNHFEKIALQNTGDLTYPEMSPIIYKKIMEQASDKFENQQVNCVIVKFGKHKVGGIFSDSCQSSESSLKIHSYYFVDHEKQLGGYTFRIIENMQEFEENGQTKYYSDSVMKKADDLIGKGIELRTLEKHEESISFYDEALEMLPDSEKSFVYSSKGVALRHLKKYDDALACYGKALTINPNDYGILFNKGILLDELEKYDDALIYFDKAIQNKPDFVQAWNAKGEVLKKMGKMDEAYQCFSKLNK
jgi:tetratricopeptide (TPR) repeat protein